MQQQARAGSNHPQMKARKRNRKIKILGIMTVVLAMITGVFLCIFVFFKVAEIKVEGNTIYNQDDIIAASGIRTGDNLVFEDGKAAVDKLKSSFSYMDSVSIKKEIPATIKIIITEADVRYSVPYNNMYAYVAASGKLLEIKESPAKGSIILHGGDIEDSSGQMRFKDDAVMSAFQDIVAVLSDKPDSGITEIDISNVYDIAAIYDGRIKMILGGVSDLAYKINFGLTIVSGSGVGKDEYGVLDLSLSRDTSKAYFEPAASGEGIDISSSSSSKDNSSSKDEGSSQENSDSGENTEVTSSDSSVPDMTYDSLPESDSEDTTSSQENSDSGSDSNFTASGSNRGDDIPDVP